MLEQKKSFQGERQGLRKVRDALSSGAEHVSCVPRDHTHLQSITHAGKTVLEGGGL